MHVLVTSDTLTGVWAYTRELVQGLVSRGVRVTLVSFGEIPLPAEASWMDGICGLDYHPTAFRLDWMEEGEGDFRESSAYLAALAREVRPDLLHLNHPCYGGLSVAAPRIVAAHGDLIGWWNAVHGHDPKPSPWLSRYRRQFAEGLAHADCVVAPSVWMLDAIHAQYMRPTHARVIYPGRNPIFLNPHLGKEDAVLAVGRLWDAGRQVSLLTRETHSLPITLVSEPAYPPTLQTPIRADVKIQTGESDVAMRGPQTEPQLRSLYSRSSIYAATSRYEPLGMASLDAAFSRCAILANDVPSHREIWADAAIYFRANDAADLAKQIRRLSLDRQLCRTYGNIAYERARECFTASGMIDRYLQLYSQVLNESRVAA